MAKAFLREVVRERERKKCQLAPEHTALGYVHGFLHSKALSAAATVRQSAAAGGNLARNYYATSSMPRTATETEVPGKEIAKIES